MPALPRRPVTLGRRRASSGVVAALTAAFFAVATSGCLSNEYCISKDELRRLAAVAPEARGHDVRVKQELGDRRSDAINPSIPDRPVIAEATQVEQTEIDINLNGSVGGGGGGRPAPPNGGVHAPPSHDFAGGGSSPPAPHGAASGGGFHGAPPSGGGGFHGAPSGGGFHGAPSGGYHVAAPAGHGGGGGGALNLGGGGAKDIGGALVIIAIVAIVAATVATVSLAASEGVKFDGHAELAPEQRIYLRRGGQSFPVALAELTPEEAELAGSAVVKDDEGYGLRRLDHAPLDRKGGVFRFDLGAGAFTLGDAHASGVSAHIQAGAFFTHTFGLVADLGLAGGTIDPCCVGALAPGGTLTRHSLGLEAELMPLAVGPLHLGAFAGGGVAFTGAGSDFQDGPMASGGLLLELDLTSHMAFALRGGASWAWLPNDSSSAGSITGGLAIY
jgi:hypothetical protein